MSKLMVAFDSQQKHNFRHMVSFYAPIKPWPQQYHEVQVYQSPVYYVLCLPFCTEVFVKYEVTEARVLQIHKIQPYIHKCLFVGYQRLSLVLTLLLFFNLLEPFQNVHLALADPVLCGGSLNFISNQIWAIVEFSWFFSRIWDLYLELVFKVYFYVFRDQQKTPYFTSDLWALSASYHSAITTKD